MSRKVKKHGGFRRFAWIAAIAAGIGAIGASQRDKLQSLWHNNSGKIPEAIRSRIGKR